MALLDILKVNSENWNQCKYEVHIEIKFSDGSKREVKPPQIEGFYIEKDFDNDHLPILMLDLALSALDERKIDNTTEFSIRVKQFYVQGKDSKEKREPKIWLNDTFVKIDYGINPDVSNKINKKIRSKNGMDEDDVAPDDLVSQSTYPLVKKDDLILSKKLVNGVITGVTQHDIFFWMMSKVGSRKPWLVSNFTNSESHKEFLVQPKGYLENMLYLEKEYGWHIEGSYIFFDFDVLYVVRKNGLPTVWRTNEPKELCFCIADTEANDNIPSGTIKRNNIVYFNLGVDQYHKSNASTIGDQVEGSNMLLINTGSGNPSSVISTTETYGTGAYATKSYHGHNPYVEKQYELRKNEQENRYQLVCMNADLGLLTPNKQVSVLTNVTKIVNEFRGNYRLGGYKATFIKNGDYFDSSAEITIEKTTK